MKSEYGIIGWCEGIGMVWRTESGRCFKSFMDRETFEKVNETRRSRGMDEMKEVKRSELPENIE